MIKEVFRLIPDLKRSIKYVVFSIIILELLKLIPHVIFKELIDTLIVFDVTKVEGIAYLVGFYFVVSILVSLIEKYAFKYFVATIVKSEVSLCKSAHKKLLDLTLGYHERHHTGRQVSKITKGIGYLNQLLWHAFFDFIPVCFQVIFVLIILFIVSWKIALLFFIFIPIFLVYTHKIALKVFPLRESYHACFERATGKLGEVVYNIRTVKDFGQEEAEKKIFEHHLSLYEDYVTQRRDIENYHGFLKDVLLQVGRIIMLSFSVYLVYIGEITPGSLVLIVTLNEKAFASLYRIARTYNFVGDSISGIERLIRLMDQKAEVKNIKGAKKSRKLRGAIEFKDVGFSYGKEEEVLQNVSFKVKPKEVIAFVGRSGCGKTTLVKLLYRHFDVNSGKILLDGKDIKSYKMESFRKNLAIVSQDIEVFNATILDNIAYGVEKHSAKEVKKASKMAHADEFIMEFKDEYSTVVGEKGVKLSGGQRQRLGIARALLRKPSILIFDEATSSLDTESEKYIQDSMKKLFKKQTMLIIAHRFSTIEHADKIIVMDKGKIVEMGSHKELMKKKGGIFRRMRKLQRLGEIR